MRYKIFENGKEINIIIADEEFVMSYCAENNYTYEEDILLTSENAEPILTTDERISTLESENAALSQQLTDTQLALCDVYEALMVLTPTDGGETV